MGSLTKLFAFMLRFAREVRFARFLIAVAVIGGILAGVSSVGLVSIVGRVLSHRQQSDQVFWIFVALCVALPVCRFVSDLSLIGIAERSQFELRRVLFEQILGAPLRRLEQVGSARMLAIMTEDVGVIIGAMTTLPLLIMHLAIVLGCLIYITVLSWKIALITLGVIVVAVIGYQLPNARATVHFSRQREAWDVMFELFKGLTSGIKELKIHQARRQAFLVDRFEPAARRRMHYRVRGLVAFSAARAWGQITLFALFGVILFGIDGRFGDFTDEALAGSVVALLYIMTPFEVLLGALPQIAQAAAAVHKAEELESELKAEEFGITRQQLDEVTEENWQELRLEGVVYEYTLEDQDESFTLGPIDLTFQRGEVTFIIGGNGSGKTTLTKLLLGLYRPDAGVVRLDDQVIDLERLEAYRQLFSVVFSDFYLFEDLIGINSEGLDLQAQDYLEKLHLEKKVKIEDGRLSTVELSQGQRKRLALLHAYLEDRQVYLFDEWAADQDPVFKQIFYDKLLPELKSHGKTVIVVSHDDRYYEQGDRLIKLVDGKVLSVVKPGTAA